MSKKMINLDLSDTKVTLDKLAESKIKIEVVMFPCSPVFFRVIGILNYEGLWDGNHLYAINNKGCEVQFCLKDVKEITAFRVWVNNPFYK